jgi:hypothetical protein
MRNEIDSHIKTLLLGARKTVPEYRHRPGLKFAA